MSGFDRACNELFGIDSKYQGDSYNHPIRESLAKFAHYLTPGMPEKIEKGENNTVADTGELHKEFRAKTTEMIQMNEEWRVMLNCDDIFAQYLRHLSSMVNE